MPIPKKLILISAIFLISGICHGQKPTPVNDTLNFSSELFSENILKNDKGSPKIITTWKYGGRAMDTGKKYFIDTIGIFKLTGAGIFTIHRTEIDIRRLVKFPEISYKLAGTTTLGKVFVSFNPDSIKTIIAPVGYLFKKTPTRTYLSYNMSVYNVTVGQSTDGCETFYYVYIPNAPKPLVPFVKIPKETYDLLK